MDTTTTATTITFGRDSRGSWVEFEGRRTWTVTTATPAELRQRAAEERQRAEEAAFRARRAEAWAAHLEAEQAAHEAQRREERRRKAAATRAKNADPFGFRAAG